MEVSFSPFPSVALCTALLRWVRVSAALLPALQTAAAVTLDLNPANRYCFANQSTQTQGLQLDFHVHDPLQPSALRGQKYVDSEGLCSDSNLNPSSVRKAVRSGRGGKIDPH